MEEVSARAHRAKENEDDWHSVTDAKKRKQIQDRLAQRARRKRLQEAKKRVELSSRALDVQSSQDKQPAENHFGCLPPLEYASQLLTHEPVNPVPCSESSIISSSPQSLCPITVGQPFCLDYELPYQFTVHGALYINGEILGIKACVAIPAKSPPVSSDVPMPLRPTQTQLITVHYTGVDRFPFPKMRDNVINLSSIIDEDELARDFFLIPSFTISPGAAPWDPRAWKIEKPFAEKWGYLLY